MKSVVFQFKIPGVLTIRITGSNEGRFGRYCTRIGKVEGEDGARVDYSSNVSGKWTIAGGNESFNRNPLVMHDKGDDIVWRLHVRELEASGFVDEHA